MTSIFSQWDDGQDILQNYGLDANRFHTFPLVPGSGLRSKLWWQILSIFEEIPLYSNNNELAEANTSKLIILSRP